MAILDTDILVGLLKGSPDAIRDNIAGEQGDSIATTIYSIRTSKRSIFRIDTKKI